MRKRYRLETLLFLLLALCVVFSGCSSKPKLTASKPVTLTMWHLYGEQADSPMNRLVDEFNQTVGKEKGIVIDVTLLSNAAQIGDKLLEAQEGAPGAPDMPDLFFCHMSNATALGASNLLDWKEYLPQQELDSYVPSFLEDGMDGENLLVLPVTKSTHLLFVAGSQFERFSEDTGITYSSLSTWEGFFQAAEAYHEWSGGKPFCAMDYLLRCVELHAISNGAEDLLTEDGWYDFSNPIFKDSMMTFAEALAKGHIVVSDFYSNTQVMTGDVVCGFGSSASILYYNDTITYSDNTQEPISLMVLPAPQPADKPGYVTQSGAGLCAYKTTPLKGQAAAVFAEWLNEEERNLNFVTETGYMPVKQAAYNAIEDYEFENPGYKNLYLALKTTTKNRTALSEFQTPDYYPSVNQFYDEMRHKQNELYNRYTNGDDIDLLKEEIWTILSTIK